MDIAALSIASSQSQLKGAVSIALMKKVMNVSKQNAESMNSMIKQMSDPNLGKVIDKRA